MKKFLLLILPALVLFLITSCKSTSKSAPEPSVTTREAPVAGPRGNRGNMQQANQEMMAQLDLNEKQKVQFQTIEQKYRDKMQTIRNNAGGDRTTMRSEMQSLRAEWDTEVKGILSAEQFSKYKELQAQRQGERRGPGRNN